MGFFSKGSMPIEFQGILTTEGKIRFVTPSFRVTILSYDRFGATYNGIFCELALES